MRRDVGEMIKELKEIVDGRNRLLIAIDGLGGSGKSTFSQCIRELDSRIEVIQMDDFYLQSNLRPKMNLEDVPDGGNFDIDRLIDQVIKPYNNDKPIRYQKYDWIEDKLGELVEIDKGKILVIEGVYSLHKSLRSYFDIKIWVECNRDLRLHRGLVRDGESAYDNWVGEWMPLEDKYVKNQKPNKVAQYIIYTDTTNEKYVYIRNEKCYEKGGSMVQNKKLSVLFLTSTFYPIIGGAETYAYELASGLVERNHNVMVITDKYIKKDNAEDQISEEFLERSGIEIFRSSYYESLLTASDKIKWEQMYFSLLNDLDEICKERKVDIIHVNSQETAILGSMLSLDMKVPLVATFHEMYPEREKYGSGRCKLAYDILPISKIIAGSKYYENKAKLFTSDRSKVVHIYHGVDTSKFSSNLNKKHIDEKYGIDETPVIISCLSRFKERKGMAELIEAFNIVQCKLNKEIKLIIAGSCSSASNEYLEYLYKLIEKLHLNDKIILDETLLYNEVPALLASSDIVVQPSYEEGLGLVVLEALSSQKPVIGTNVSGISEIIAENVNGLLVEAKNIDELASAIVRLVEQKDLASRLAEEGRKMVISRFEKAVMVEKTEELYYQVISETK